jgi:HAD superfamily hydrolase (TIGR01450 family)
VRPDLSRFEAILLDLDGTIYHEDEPLPGAVDFVRALQRAGRRYGCLSNSISSPERLATRLRTMGLDVPPALMYTAAVAGADYVLAKYPERPRVFNLASRSMATLLEGRVIWVSDGTDSCDVVVAGGPSGDMAGEDRQRVALALLRRGAALIGLCADRVFPSPRGIEFGAGAMTAMLAYAANVVPVFCGKPEPHFFLDLCARLGVRPSNCVLIGDNLESDIAGARRVGMTSILVLSGVASQVDVAAHDETHRPDYIVESLVDLVAAI